MVTLVFPGYLSDREALLVTSSRTTKFITSKNSCIRSFKEKREGNTKNKHLKYMY